MIITQVAEDDNKDGHGDGATIQLQTPKNTEIPSSRFWGVKISPQQPVTVTFRNGPYNFLHISQASLGEVCGGTDNRENPRCGVLSKIGDNPEVLICSLRLKYKEMTSLSLDFDGPNDVVFSVNGSWEIHLVGHFFYHPSPTFEIQPLQLVGNGENNAPSKKEGGICSSRNEGGCVASEHQLISASNEGGMCKQVDPKLDLVSQMNIPPLYGKDVDVDVADGSNKIRKDGGISILVQGLTETQFETFGESMIEKLQGSMKGGSSDYHVLQSRKKKRRSKRNNHDDEEQNDHFKSSKPDYCQNLLLDSKEAKKTKKTLKKKKKKLKKHKKVGDENDRLHELSQDVALDTREAKEARKPKQKVVQEEVRVVNDGQQTFAYDFGDVKNNIVEDDSIRSAQNDDMKGRKNGKKVVEVQARSHKAQHLPIVCALPCQGKR